MLIDRAGRVVLGGSFGLSGERMDAAVLRLDPAGALDPSFGQGGIARLDLGGPTAKP
jgi:hypothetical protein